MKNPSAPKELAAKSLRQVCDPKMFPFDTTDEAQELKGVYGHDRAVTAIEFGLSNKSKGFNIFLLGDSGSGKTSILRNLILKRAKTEPTPSDWIYVHNFEDPGSPKAMALPPGKGEAFKKDMAGFVEDLKRIIPRMQEGDSFLQKGNEIEETFRKKEEKAFKKLQRAGKAKQLLLDLVQSELIIQVMKDGKPLVQEEFEALSPEEHAQYEEQVRSLQDEIGEFLRFQRKLEKQRLEKVSRLEDSQIREVAREILDELKEKYDKTNGISDWFDQVCEHVPEAFQAYQRATEEEQNPEGMPLPMLPKPEFKELKVNVFVNNKGLKGAPIVFENTPTYHNLIGCTEYTEQYGMLHTDFTLVRPGALHLANGGYLVIQAHDLMKSFYAWESLKKSLRNKEITIQELDIEHRARSTVSPKPQPIPLSTKVILIGNAEAYYFLLHMDDDFQRLFKVKAEFNEFMPRNKANIMKMVGFITRLCREDDLLPFHRDALARIVELASRTCEHQKKLTTRFINIINIVSEANYWASMDKATQVHANHVDQALAMRRNRACKVEDEMYEYLREGTVLLDTKGDVVGQINGIALYDMGDHAFGIPSRITAQTYTGSGGVVNIDREARLTGVIHNKASLILIGIIGSLYARNKPLSLSASLVFEQMYGNIDGDSASCAELFALVSSLADLPIDQGIAVTGSVNQRGEVQPIGGVNEKIEGVYRICKTQGLTGKQGVIIPEKNRINLMLDREIVEAVENGKFHIYPISTIDQGLEIVMHHKAGKRLKSGNWPKDTIHWRADNRLRELSKNLQDSGDDDE